MASTVKIPQLFHRAYRPATQCTSQYLSSHSFLPIFSHRHASGLSLKGKKDNQSKSKTPSKKKKKARPTFRQYDLKDMVQFSLCDAMRYIRAFEVGRSPVSSKYDLALKIRTLKNGPAVRNRLRLPHPVHTNLRIGVICPSPSPVSTAALAAGATICGEETLFDTIREGTGALPFDRLLCHTDSLPKLNKANLGKILGPKGLMPSAKFNTVTKDVVGGVKGMVGASEYREKIGVIRLAIGQLGFTPEQLQRNIRHFMEGVKRDFSALSDTVTKEIHEVVLSSTNAPGFSLNGDFRSSSSPPSKDLSVS